MDISIFKTMKDEDFFSDKLQHIYFTSEVTDESVNDLLTKIHKANNPTFVNKVLIQPKPIIIHISSLGGDLTPALRFLTAFKDSKVPICTIVDNYSASAATILSINSPYRLVTEYSLTLIHQYSTSINGMRERLLNELKIAEETSYAKLFDMYLNRTKLKKKELQELLKHDIWFNATDCLKKGIADRILKFNGKHEKISKEYNLKVNDLIKQPDFNNIYISCKTQKEQLDNLLKPKDLIKPVIIHPQTSDCSDNSGYYVMSQGFSLISRIRTLEAPSFCIIETPISLDDLLPMLYCSKRYIYEHSSVICNLIYFEYKSILLADTIKNTNTVFDLIKKILKSKTKLPDKIINNINTELIILSPQQCLKYGLCDEVIKLYK